MPVNLHLGPCARSATGSVSASRVTPAGSGVKRSTSWVGRSTRSWGQHRATSDQGNLPSLRQREGDPGDLLVVGQGSRGDNAKPRLPHLSQQPQPAPEPQQLLAIDVAADVFGCPI